eukprot:sb/3465946/
MALFADGGFSSPDIYIVIYLVILSALGITLNGTVIYRNFRKPSTIARNLYLSLFITDFLTCATLPSYFAYATFTPKNWRCFEAEKDPESGYLINCTTHYLYFCWPNPTIGQRLYSNMVRTIVTHPCLVTRCLATCRFYQIRYPFSRVPSKYPLAFIITTAIYSLVFKVDLLRPKGEDTVAYYYVIPQGVFETLKGGPFTSLGITFKTTLEVFIASNIFNVLAQFMGLIASILTIRELILNSMKQQVANPALARSESRKRRSTIMILVYNLGSITTVCSCIVYSINLLTHENLVEVAIRNHTPYDIPISIVLTALAYFLFVPSFCSLVDPTVCILFTPRAVPRAAPDDPLAVIKAGFSLNSKLF